MQRMFTKCSENEFGFQFMQVATIQAETNALAKADWIQNPPDYYAAVLVEVGECIDHLDYKWWKGDAYVSPDYDQARMEIVDIGHFLFSLWYLESRSYVKSTLKAGSKTLNSKLEEELSRRGSSYYEHLPRVVNQAHAEQAVPHLKLVCQNRDVYSWLNAMQSLGMTWEEFYFAYMGKAALNRFRWSVGYEGKYVKNWAPDVEDNIFLTAILDYYKELNLGLTLDALQESLRKTYDLNVLGVDGQDFIFVGDFPISI